MPPRTSTTKTEILPGRGLSAEARQRIVQNLKTATVKICKDFLVRPTNCYRKAKIVSGRDRRVTI